MDIHEAFEYKVDELKKVILKFNENQDDGSEYTSEWDIFSEFLKELIRENDRFKNVILDLFFEEDLELCDKMKDIFNALVNFDDKILTSMTYLSGRDKVTIEYDKIDED